MFERLTDRAQNVMTLANQHAERLGHKSTGAVHILLGLLQEGKGIGARVLGSFDIDLAKIQVEIERLVEAGQDPVGTGARSVIQYAMIAGPAD